MDTFCIDRGTLLDRPSLTTLGPEGPPGHSVHCLVDIGICNSSPFEVLEELDDGSYGRAWRVEDNELLLSHARSLGSCSTCEDSGSLVRGYQATVLGIVQELASGDIPPVISVNEVADVEDFERLCNEKETQIEDNEVNIGLNASVTDFESNITITLNETMLYTNITSSNETSSNETSSNETSSNETSSDATSSNETKSTIDSSGKKHMLRHR